MSKGLYRATGCDVTGDVASLNFDATELQIFKVILEAQVTQICSMDILRLTIDFIKCPKVWSLWMEFYGAWQEVASFPGSSACVGGEKKPGTHCLRMLSFPRISGNLEIFCKICSITLTSARYANFSRIKDASVWTMTKE